jgi:VIT1/CCC1 family predicted Fe2+/Mn2+ transporter
MPDHQPEQHRTNRSGWLRAAVLGANDGVVSTASLIVGVAAAQTTKSGVLVAGVAGLVAGAMSMAAGEYVSVSSQADTERADIARESHEIDVHTDFELKELASIYAARGLEPALADQVAEQLMAHDPLAAHSRDELGISESLAARPVQAALASAGFFVVGAVVPLLVVVVAPQSLLVPVVFGASLVFLAVLGVFSAKTGGAPVFRAVLRVTFWGVLAMALTAAVGSLFGVAA